MIVNTLVAEDHPIFLQGVLSILNTDKNLNVVGTANDGEEAVKLSKKLHPELVVMDISMPNLDGIEATKLILASNPKTKVLALSIHKGKRFVQGMLNAGAKGYLIKDSASDELLTAINCILSGDMYLSSEITQTALGEKEKKALSIKPSILQTKLYRPKISGDYIQRKELIEQLENNIDKPLSLISASAGFGKSITVSEWLNTSSAQHAWISLDDEHNDLRMFLSYLQVAIENVYPGLLNHTGNILLGAGELPQTRIVAAILINELDELEHPFVLVLDDFHRINNAKVLELVNELIKFPPEQLHLCMITRRDPLLNLNKLRMQNRMLELRMDNLAFTVKETIGLAKKIRNIDLDEGVAQELQKQTEGWIVGIYLSLMSLNPEIKQNELAKNLKGNLLSTSEFLMEEVLASQESWVQKILLFSSVLNRFSIDLINEIIKVKMPEHQSYTGHDFVKAIFKANLFAIPLDSHKEWFRFHHLFQDLLKLQLKRNYTKEQIADLHILVSKWFEKNDYLEEAFKHCLELNDIKSAASIIEKKIHVYENQKKWYLLQKHIDCLPNEFIDTNPSLIISQALVHFYQLTIHEIPPLLQKIDAIEQCTPISQDIKGKKHTLSGFVAFYNGQGEKAVKDFKKAIEYLPANEIGLLATANLYLAHSEQMIGKYKNTIKHVHQKIKQEEHPVILIYDYWSLIMLQIIEMDLAEASENLRKQHDLTLRSNMEYAISWCFYLDGLSQLVKGNTEKAILLLEEVNDKKYVSFPRAAIDALVLLAIAYQLKGDEKKADEVLEELENFCALYDRVYASIVISAKSHIEILRSGNGASSKWINGNNKPDNEVAIFWYEIPAISWCKALIAEGSAESLQKAKDSLLELLTLNTEQNNKFQLVKVHILLAVLCERLNKQNEALVYLNNALKLAQLGSMVLPFKMGFNSIQSMLITLPKSNYNPRFIEKLLSYLENKSFDEESKNRVKPLEPTISTLKTLHDLSIREQEILKLVAEGLRNKEIATELYISVDTVKKHVYNIFQKMGVKKRLELINKAIDLNIVSKAN